MTLRLSRQEQAVYDLFRVKAKRTLAELVVIYPPGGVPAAPAHALTAVLRSLGAKLAVMKKGRLERVSALGRGHAGVYRLKRR